MKGSWSGDFTADYKKNILWNSIICWLLSSLALPFQYAKPQPSAGIRSLTANLISDCLFLYYSPTKTLWNSKFNSRYLRDEAFAEYTWFADNDNFNPPSRRCANYIFSGLSSKKPKCWLQRSIWMPWWWEWERRSIEECTLRNERAHDYPCYRNSYSHDLPSHLIRDILIGKF